MTESPGALFEQLLEIMTRLRGADGCPWDREQTRESLKPYLIEEAYEVLEAIESGAPEALREELGDLLFQVVFHTCIALERGEFDMADLLFDSGWRTRRPPTKRKAAAGVATASEVEHALCQRRRQPSVDNEHRHVVAPNDRIARVRDVDRHS